MIKFADCDVFLASHQFFSFFSSAWKITRNEKFKFSFLSNIRNEVYPLLTIFQNQINISLQSHIRVHFKPHLFFDALQAAYPGCIKIIITGHRWPWIIDAKKVLSKIFSFIILQTRFVQLKKIPFSSFLSFNRFAQYFYILHLRRLLRTISNEKPLTTFWPLFSAYVAV